MSLDPSDLPDLTEVDPELLVSDDVLDSMSEDELAAYIEVLRKDAGEWRLQPVQQRAQEMSKEVDELFFGGAMGGGKTEFMLYHAYHECLEHPGLRVLALRRTFPQLRESLIERSLQRFDPKVAKYLPSEKRWRFENGSEIKFGFCDAEDDYRHYLSTEYDLLVWEELTEFTEKQYRMICTRNRTSVTKQKRGIRPHIIAASNPGQIGASWVKAHFIHPTEYGQKTYESEILVGDKIYKRKIGFVPSKSSDNKYLPENYQANLGTLGEHFRRMYLEGDWDALEGSFFADFSRANNVIEPFLIPKEWPRVRGIDYGMAKPYACIWVAFDQDGNAYVYREDYQTGLTATQQAKRVVEMSRYADSKEVYGRDAGRPEDFDRTVADPSVFNRTGAGMSIGSMYHKAGLVATKGMNARIDGWSRMKDYIRGEDHPKLYVFSSCQNLINEMTGAVYDDVRQEDLDTHGDDHACFVAGTMVATPDGERPIEEIRPGDFVLTRYGPRRVELAGKTAARTTVITVEFSNGRSLTGTPNHPVFTTSGRKIRLDRVLEYTSIRSMLRSCILLSSSTKSPSTSRIGSTSSTRSTTARASGSFIVRSGRRTSDRSPRATTSITSIATAATTTRATSPASPPNSTGSSIVVRSGRTSLSRSRPGRVTPGGVSSLGPGSSTLSTPSRSGRTWSPWSTPARSAARSTRPSTVARISSAATTAKQKLAAALASTMRTGSVSSAVKPSAATSTPARRCVAGYAVASSDAGLASVYNLKVEEHAEYFANGVLVSNCDALRYALMARNRSARKGKPALDPRSPAARLERAVRKRQQEKRDHQILGNWR